MSNSKMSSGFSSIKDNVNPNVSVDCVIFGFDEDNLKVLLIERTKGIDSGLTAEEPDFLALPGDLIYEREDLDLAARRVLLELTGLRDLYLEQFHTFGNPDRISKQRDIEWLRSVRANPDARVITVAYFSLISVDQYTTSSGSFARKSVWVPVSEVPVLAFDHNLILETALSKLKERLYRQPVGFELLPEKFTLAQLQRLYEIILCTTLDKRNFRRKILKTGFVKALNERQKGVPHKPAQLFRFDEKAYLKAEIDFFTI